MELTEKQIMKVFNLQPWDEFLKDREENWLPMAIKHVGKDNAHTLEHRRTGRTTKIAIQALIEMSRGKKVFLCGPVYSRLTYQLRQIKNWAEKLELDPNMIKPVSDYSLSGRSGKTPPGTVTIWDHEV